MKDSESREDTKEAETLREAMSILGRRKRTMTTAAIAQRKAAARARWKGHKAKEK